MVIMMDGDAAGQDSDRRVANAVTAVGRRVLVTRLPAGEDPASWLSAHGPAGLAVLVVGARPFISGSDESNGADDNVRVGLSW
jgi:DNA primase